MKKMFWKTIFIHILPYLTIILILLNLIYFLYSTNLQTSQDVTNTYLSSNLEKGIYTLENTVKSINDLSNNILSYQSIRMLSSVEYMKPSDYYYVYSFQQSKEFASLLHTLCYQPSDKVIITLPNNYCFVNTHFAADTNKLFQNYFYPQQISEEEWVAKVKSDPSFWPSQYISFGREKAKLYLPYNTIHREGSPVTLFLSEESLAKLFFGNQDYQSLGFEIYYGEQLIFSKPLSNSSEAYEIKRESKYLSLTFSIQVSQYFYAEQMTSLKKNLFIYSFLCILLCSALSFIFAFRNSKPFTRLTNVLNQYGRRISQNNSVNEAILFLSELDQDRTNIQKKLQETKRAFCSLEFEYMLWSSGSSGTYHPKGITIFNPSRLVFLKLTSSDSSVNIETLVSKIEDLHIIKGEIHIVSASSLVILLKETTQIRQQIYMTLKKINQTLFPSTFRCGVSTLFQNVDKIRMAFMEAENALVDSTEQLCFFEDIDLHQLNKLESIRYYETLDKALNGFQDTPILAFFDTMEKDVATLSIGSNIIRQACYYVRNILLAHLNLASTSFMNLYYVPCGDELTVYRTYLAEARNLALKIIDKNRSKQKSHNNLLKNSIAAFIQENYTDPNLSLTYISNAFDVSAKYISDFLKEQLGVNYIEFLQEFRLKKACELLNTTKKNINDIALACGFNSPNTFYKSFRKYFGYSPSEYRKKNLDRSVPKP